MTAAADFLSFVNASPSPFHAVQAAKQRLLGAGFLEIKEKLPWSSDKLLPLGKYFFTRNQSSVVAFAVGGKFVPGNGFSAVVSNNAVLCLLE